MIKETEDKYEYKCITDFKYNDALVLKDESIATVMDIQRNGFVETPEGHTIDLVLMKEDGSIFRANAVPNYCCHLVLRKNNG